MIDRPEESVDSPEEIENRKIKAKQYEKIHNILFVADILYTLILIFVFIFVGGKGGFSAQLAGWIKQWCSNYWLQIAVYISLLTTGYMVCLLPFNYYSGYYLEHKYNLSTQSLFSWFKDRIKSFLLNIVFMVLLGEVLYLFFKFTQNTWWLWLSVIWVLFGIVLSNIFPVLILPLFYKYKPLENDELAKRLISLAERVNARILGVFELELSAKTKKANAALTGMGNTKRILLGDTLLENFTDDEIEVVLAHELGHFYYKHIWKLIFFGGFITFIGLWATSLVLAKLVVFSGFAEVSQIGAFPLFLLCMFLFALVSMPVNSTFSRILEKQADLFALRETKSPKHFITAMRRLANLNLADEEPHPLIEFFLHDHPSISRRVKLAEDFMDSEP
ncbi:M48 family metallopeptidase [bacterium]|nr:M48 family metallopeptidase [bacterium]